MVVVDRRRSRGKRPLAGTAAKLRVSNANEWIQATGRTPETFQARVENGVVGSGGAQVVRSGRAACARESAFAVRA